MQPHRSGTGATVEAEGKGTLARVADVIFGIRDVKDAGLGCAILKLQQDRTGCCGVFDFLPADFQGVLGLHDLFFRSRWFLFFFRLFPSFILCWSWLLLSEAQIQSQKKNNGTTQN